MPTKVLFLGLDAADADLIDRWAADGELPNLAALGQRQITSRMETAAGMFPGGMWFELASGRLAQHSGRFFETRNPRTGDHTPASRLWLGGPGVPSGLDLDRPRSVDIAPTILGLLDVPRPDHIDGRDLLA